jgi:hypothetical protein
VQALAVAALHSQAVTRSGPVRLPHWFVVPEQHVRPGHGVRLARVDERCGHPAGPAGLGQPGAGFGEMVLGRVGQERSV